jgi:16S rRNA (uracil1498-N3)-methyltransferase
MWPVAHVPRIYSAGHLAPGPLLIDGEHARRLAAVMRVRTGEEFRLFAGDGREWQATVTEVGRQAIRAEVGAVTRQEPPAPLTVEAWVAVVRANRFDWIVEKCTETGADVIRPFVSEYAARGEGPSAGRADRWQRIATEAAEQCGRLYLPAIEPAAPFDDLLSHHHGPLLLADASGSPWVQTAPLLPLEGRLAIIVGPEGGLSAEEVARARSRGALVTSLGPNTLRTETAAVVAVGLVRAIRG